MSTLVSQLIDDAAQQIGDPNKERIPPEQWLSIYNQSIRKLCEKVNILKFRNIFSLSTNQAYTYPLEMTVMTGLEATETAGDDDSWRSLDEMFEDEFRSRTSTRYPSASIPTHYFATAGWFYLIPRPSAAIVGGGRITHFGLPDRVIDITTATVQTEAITEEYIINRMVVAANFARNRLVEAKAALEIWEAETQTLQDKLDDRSQDRRSSVAPRKNRFQGMR